MKNIFLSLILFAGIIANAQDTRPPQRASRGLSAPFIQLDTLSTVQRDALVIPSPNTRIIYHKDTGINRVEWWDGDSWEVFGSPDLSNYVTLDGTETVTGEKTFSNAQTLFGAGGVTITNQPSVEVIFGAQKTTQLYNEFEFINGADRVHIKPSPDMDGNLDLYLPYMTANDTIALKSQLSGGGGLANIVEDLTPQLGGNLDAQDNFILNLEGISSNASVFSLQSDGDIHIRSDSDVVIGIDDSDSFTTKEFYVHRNNQGTPQKLLSIIESGEASLPLTTITNINSVGSKAIITKEYGDANYGGGSESTTVSDTAEIDLTLTGVDITADLVVGGIDVLKLDSGVQTSLGLADTALQSSDLANYVTLSGAQTITGIKTFAANVRLNNNFPLLLGNSGSGTLSESSSFFTDGTNTIWRLYDGDLILRDGTSTERFRFTRTTGDFTATSFNGVALTDSGSATNFLNEQGNYVSGSGTDDQTAAEVPSVDTAFDIIEGTDVQTNLNSIDGLILDVRSTGVRFGGALTINGGDPALVDISALEGFILDNTDPQNPVPYAISYAGATGVTITNTGVPLTYWYLDNAGALQQTTTEPTRSLRRTRLYLGWTSFTGGAIQATISDITPTQQIGDQLSDLISFFGEIKSGLLPSEASTDLTIKVSAGEIFEHGVNFQTDATDPHVKTLAATNPQTFQMATENGGSGSDITILDVGNYNPTGSTVSAVGGGPSSSTIFTIYKFAPTGDVRIQYGNVVYSSLTAAEEALDSGAHNPVLPPVYQNAIVIGYIVVDRTTTDLSDTGDAIFVSTGIFGDLEGGVSGLSGSYLEISNNLNDLANATTATQNLGVEVGVDVVSYTAPQVGGDIDLNGNEITTTVTNGGIIIRPNGTGIVTAVGDSFSVLDSSDDSSITGNSGEIVGVTDASSIYRFAEGNLLLDASTGVVTLPNQTIGETTDSKTPITLEYFNANNLIGDVTRAADGDGFFSSGSGGTLNTFVGSSVGSQPLVNINQSLSQINLNADEITFQTADNTDDIVTMDMTVITTGRDINFPNVDATLVASVNGVFANTVGNIPLNDSETIQIACSDLITDITTGTSKGYFRMPYAMTITDVRVSLIDAGTSTGLTVDINETGASIFSTLLTTDATEETSETATTPYVLSDTALADDAKITIDFDATPTAGKGVIVTINGYRL